LLPKQGAVGSNPITRSTKLRDKAIFSLFLESFIRLDELAELKVEDIDIQQKRVLVRKGKMGKGRLAGFGPKTQKSLWYLRRSRPYRALPALSPLRHLEVRIVGEVGSCSPTGRPTSGLGVLGVFSQALANPASKESTTRTQSYLLHSRSPSTLKILGYALW